MLMRLRLAFRVLIVCHVFPLNGSKETKILSSRKDAAEIELRALSGISILAARIPRLIHPRTLPSEANCFLGISSSSTVMLGNHGRDGVGDIAIYGATSYTASQRRREIVIRLALGPQRGRAAHGPKAGAKTTFLLLVRR